jgi:hypothetical protein
MLYFSLIESCCEMAWSFGHHGYTRRENEKQIPPPQAAQERDLRVGMTDAVGQRGRRWLQWGVG